MRLAPIGKLKRNSARDHTTLQPRARAEVLAAGCARARVSISTIYKQRIEGDEPVERRCVLTYASCSSVDRESATPIDRP